MSPTNFQQGSKIIFFLRHISRHISWVSTFSLQLSYFLFFSNPQAIKPSNLQATKGTQTIHHKNPSLNAQIFQSHQHTIFTHKPLTCRKHTRTERNNFHNTIARLNFITSESYHNQRKPNRIIPHTNQPSIRTQYNQIRSVQRQQSRNIKPIKTNTSSQPQVQTSKNRTSHTSVQTANQIKTLQIRT